MNSKKTYGLSAFLLGLALTSTAHSQVINLDVDASLQTLSDSVFNRQFNNVSILGASYTGDNLQIGSYTTDGNTFLDDRGLSSGVVLSTGSTLDAVGLTNTSDKISTQFGNPGSDLISELTGQSSADAATFSVDFQIGEQDNLRGDAFATLDLQFAFGSDEFNFFNGFGVTENNDTFSLSIDGRSITNDSISVDFFSPNGGENLNLLTPNFDGQIATEANGLNRGFVQTGPITIEAGVQHTVEFTIADVGFNNNDSVDSFIFFSLDTELFPGFDIPEPVAVPELSARGASLTIIFLMSILLLMSEKKTGRESFRHQLA